MNTTQGEWEVTDEDRYLFDLRGFLVLRNVLSADEVAALNDEIDRRAARPTAEQPLVVIPSNPGGVETPPLPEPDGFLLWHEGFRNLIDHPAVLPYLKEWLSPSLHLETCIAICNGPGYKGQELHFGNTPFVDWAYYFFRDRPHCGLTNVSWALTDTTAGSGGFACIPGSHKANYPCPPSFNVEGELPDGVVQVPVRAGDAVIFTEALTHAGMPWREPEERRILLYRYMPGHMAWEHCDLPPEVLDALTPSQKWLVEPPYVRRPVVQDGRRVAGHLRPPAGATEIDWGSA